MTPLVRLALAAFGAALIAAAPGQADIGWRWENPRPTPDHLRGVWGSSSDDVYAVGSYGTVLHFDGAAWSVVLQEWANFESIHGSGPEDVWVAGGEVFRYDGARWSRVDVDPDWSLQGLWVRGVDDVYAVGFEVDKAFFRGIVVHFDGTAWTELSTGSSEPLAAIWGTGSELFAVGRSATILHFDGQQWDVRTGAGSQSLYGVWGSGPTNVFAAGTAGAVLRYDGESWSPMPGAPNGYVTSLHGAASNDVYAALYDGSIYRFDGAGWSRERAADDSTPFGVWTAGGGRAMAVAAAGRIFERAVEGAWYERNRDSREFLLDVWSDGAGAAFAVGTGQTLLRWDSNRWHGIGCWTPSPEHLWAVWGSSASDVWAVGSDGLLLHYDGASCAAVQLHTQSNLYDVWGTGPDDVYVTGDANWHFDGARWHPIEIGDAKTIRAVWGPSSEILFAVGDGGAVFRRDGGEWLPMASGTDIDLVSVWGSSAADVWAVGGDFVGSTGVVLHYDGGAWSTVPVEPTHETRFQVAGRGPDDVYVVGIYGIVHFDGERWTRIDEPWLLDARAVSIVDERETLFVGPNGAIARRLALFTSDFGFGRPCVWSRVVPDPACGPTTLPLAGGTAGR